MKKGMTFLGVLAMAVVVTSYSVSGTYAKYVSEIDLADEARVAKWEIGLTEDTEKTFNLFQESYDYVMNDQTNKEVVKSLNGKRVVAPGTKGQYTFALTGEIETNYRINLIVSGDNNVTTEYSFVEDGVTKTETYDPMRFYLSTNDSEDIDTIANENLLTFTELKEALANLYSGESDTVYAPGKVNVPSYTIYWKWDFNGNDTQDTELGKSAEDHLINLKITIRAEQTRDAATTTTGA